MAPKNKGKAFASSLVASQAPTRSSAPPRGNRAQSYLPCVINKHGILFVDDMQCDAMMLWLLGRLVRLDILMLNYYKHWACGRI